MTNKYFRTSIGKIGLVWIFALMMLGIDCYAQGPIEIHPQESRMPFADLEATILKKQFDPDIARMYARQHVAFYSYGTSSKSVELDLLLQSKWDAHVVSLSRNRILVLDRIRSQLVEFNTKNGSKLVIADRGRGATDLFFPKSLVIEGTMVYVPMGGYRITAFDCSNEPCTLSYTVPLDKVNSGAMDLIGDDFLVLRHASGLSNDHPDIETIGAYSASIIDGSGKVVKSFGASYTYGKHWMLLDAFQKGHIVNLAGSELIGLAHETFPYVYVYDHDRQISKKLKLPNFMVGERRYEPDTGALHISYKNFSHIAQMNRVDGERIIIEVSSRGGDGYAENYQRSSYFILDPKRNRLHHMGDVSGGAGRLLFTDHGVLHVTDEYVWWMPFE